MWRRAARVQRNVPFRVTSRTACHCSSVISVSTAVPPSPALLTRTSSPPVSLTTVSNRRWTSSSLVTSHGTARTPPSCSADSASRRSWRSLRTTSAPSSAHRLAVAKPMPVPAAAVTSTVLPWSRAWPSGYGGGSVIPTSPGLSGKAQGLVADDVALDLVRTRVDRVGAAEQEHPLEGRLVEGGVHALHVHGQVAQLAVPQRPEELVDRRLGPRLAVVQRAQVVKAHHPQPHQGLHDAVTHDRVVEGAVVAPQLD